MISQVEQVFTIWLSVAALQKSITVELATSDIARDREKYVGCSDCRMRRMSLATTDNFQIQNSFHPTLFQRLILVLTLNLGAISSFTISIYAFN